MKVLVGTCGFQKSRRTHYANLDVLEVQQTFYDPRDLKSFIRWRREAPEHFIFTVKAWMLVSHEAGRLWSRIKKPIPGNREGYGGLKLTGKTIWAWEETLKAADILGAPVIVLQTPPSFGYSEVNLSVALKFFTSIERRGRIIVWEPRGSWWDRVESIKVIAREAGIIIGGDILRGRMPPQGQDLVYARLHGLGGEEVNYRYKYMDSDLEKLKAILLNLDPRGAYVLFNNIYSYDDAIRFKRIIS